MGNKKNIRYKIFKSKGLILECYHGKHSLSELIAYKEKQVEDPHYNPNFTIISDIRSSDLDLDDDDIEQIAKYPYKNPKLYGERKVVYLTETPHQVVIGSLMKQNKANLPYDIFVCSTLAAAIDWLGLNPSDESLLCREILTIKNM